MSTKNRMLDLVRALIDHTHKGRVSWKPTDVENTFIYSAPNSSITVGGRHDNEGDFNVTVRLLNKQGTVAEEMISTWENERFTNGDYAPGPNNGILEDLYQAARQSALKIDDIIDDIISSLDGE